MATPVTGVAAVADQLVNQVAMVGVEKLDYGQVTVDGIETFKNALSNGGLEASTPNKGIVDSVQAVRDQFLKIQHHLEGLASKGKDFSSADLLSLQFDVQQLGYITELSVKTADKTSQGAQTLFRNQG